MEQERLPVNFANLQDPFLIDFVRYVHTITDPNKLNKPTEIHIVLLGLAGFSVDLTGFGDLIQGFFSFVHDWDIQNNTNLANNIYLVPLLEERVVDGLQPESLPGPGNYVAGRLPQNFRQAAHQPAPYWDGYRRKFLQRVRVRDLIDRWDLRRQVLETNVANGTANPVPGSGFGAAYDDQLDRLTDAVWEEMAGRSGWLDGPPNATVPSAN
jgi:hypothetical protein